MNMEVLTSLITSGGSVFDHQEARTALETIILKNIVHSTVDKKELSTSQLYCDFILNMTWWMDTHNNI